MGYILLLAPLLLIFWFIGTVLKMQQRIDRLEEQIASGYSDIVSDLHRRVEALEQERRNSY